MSRPREPGRPAKGHAGRQRKLSCPACGFIAYASAAAVCNAGLPTCGCGEPLVIANLRDIERIDPEGFERLIGSLSHKAHTAAMRELGYTNAIVRRSFRSRIPQPQCAKDGCSRFRAYGVKYCRKHEELEALPF